MKTQLLRHTPFLWRRQFKGKHASEQRSEDCPGNPCPDFSGTCNDDPDMAYCNVPGIQDVAPEHLKGPLNCPALRDANNPRRMVYNASCSHEIDAGVAKWQYFQVYRLRNVYVNHQGQMFNATTHFVQEGCNQRKHFSHDPRTAPTVVHRTKRLVNLVYRQSALNFYHALVEWMPQFHLLAPLLRAMPDVPLLGLGEQWEVYERLVQPLVGVPLDSFPHMSVKWNELFFAEEVFVPIYQGCGVPSPSLWDRMRSRFLLPPNGLPMFRPDQPWTPATEDGITAVAPRVPHDVAAADDWLVVLSHRNGTTKRVLSHFDQLRAAVESTFGRERVRVFEGGMGIMEARALFSQARVLVAGHGAGMANMIFMRPNSLVLEIRPNVRQAGCFHFLAVACGHRYYMNFGKSDKRGPEGTIHIDVRAISKTLKTIALQIGKKP
eukprot:TRINITY_DN11963_c0_g1_i5.p1 TRINITY_DN11963_c0_g1~~TRINITY_DN11963_c0_g1_i5.p1  ORF type:complete len:499 (-),score=8.46 TRINITY_DN11963_c0_g1_i5:89-1393(-)